MADFGALPKGEGYGLVPRWVMCLPDVKQGPKALYASLCTNASPKGILWRSIDRLAAEFNVDRRQIQRWLNELEAAGLIVRFSMPRRSFLVIRDPGGRDWARRENLKSVTQRRAVFASCGREGARRKKELATPASCQNDTHVVQNATSTSPKHDLTNKITLTDEAARQDGGRGTGGAPNPQPYGLKRLNPNPKSEIIQGALNRLADQIGWERVGNIDARQLAAGLAATNPGAFTETEAMAALSSGPDRRP